MIHRPRRVLALALAAVLVVGVGGIVAGRTLDARAASIAASRLPVVGYAEAGSTTTARVRADAATVTTLGVDGINVTSTGGSITPVSPDALRLLADAHSRHQRAELLVGNFDGDLGDFSPAIGERLLGSPSRIAAVVAALARDVETQGWDGVTVDLESLSGRDPAGLTTFVHNLKRALGRDKSVSICLMATTDGYADLGYQLGALGRVADHVVLMAYDQHGPGWSKAGPVGGQPWVEASLAPLRRAIPAAKIQLGVAGYGYTFPKKGIGEQVSDADARSLVKRSGGTATWNATQSEWHATLDDGTVVWWSDARTLAARKALAVADHLGGVAVWSVGLSDPLI